MKGIRVLYLDAPFFSEHKSFMKKFFFLFSLMFCTLQVVAATPQDTPNKARQEFEKIYNMVFGPQGSTLRYDVNGIRARNNVFPTNVSIPGMMV